MDDPSAQLQLDLRAAVTEALGSRRPLLHHLNADTSWLLQIPRPKIASSRGGRFYFNILIDPWLAGGQSDVAKWFSQQFHATESKVGSIAAVEELLRGIEILATGLRLGQGRKSSADELEDDGEAESFIDAVAISHEFTDHCHKDTLLEVHPDVPVFATAQAASLIKSWSHFRSVTTTPEFSKENPDWHSVSVAPLPEWLAISRLVTKGDVLYYHSALMIVFNNADARKDDAQIDGDTPDEHNVSAKRSARKAKQQPSEVEEEGEAEAVIYTPHGIHSEDLAVIPKASPPIHTLAFLHGLHDISIGSQQQLNLGAHNGLKAQRLLNASYWISTHDEVKTGGGLVSWFLRRKVISLKDALSEERSHLADGAANGGRTAEEKEETKDVLDSFEDTRWIELDNGESRVLI